MSELLHIRLFALRLLLLGFIGVMMNQFLQLFDPYFIKFKLLLLFLQNQQLLFLLYSLLNELAFDSLNLLIPASLGLLSLLLQLRDLLV
jgi:hypothetical protein